MLNIESKIELYFEENLLLLKNLNSFVVNDVSDKNFILSDKIYDFIKPIMSNYSSFSLLGKMLNEYVYDLNISKIEKEYFLNKIYERIGALRNSNYLDVPDSVDRKSLVAFEEEYTSSLKGFLVGFIVNDKSVNVEFRAKCLNSLKEDSSSMTIFFIKENLNAFPRKFQQKISVLLKKYLRRELSVLLIFPIVKLHYFLMLSPNDVFHKQISRESVIEKVEQDIIESCTTILERNHQNKTENQINDYLTDLLRAKKINIADQTRSGQSLSKLSEGQIDIMVRDEKGLPLMIVECLKLSRVSSKGKNQNLTDHILKLIDNYDGLGLSNKCLIVYCFSDNFDDFQDSYSCFLRSFRRENANKGLRIESVGLLRKPFGNDISNFSFIPTFHKINGVYQKINHYLLNLQK
jgi:hypothetical protein